MHGGPAHAYIYAGVCVVAVRSLRAVNQSAEVACFTIVSSLQDALAWHLVRRM